MKPICLISKKGFTLAEVLIVVAIIAILAGTLLMGNIRGPLQKARDSKRKQDINKITRTLEDFYNDYQHYPVGNIDSGTFADAAWGSDFSPYIPLLPKDPLSPSRDYYYQTGPSLQNFFALYAKLENTADPDIEEVGCQDGCGPGRAYNYVVYSPNVIMLGGFPTMDPNTPRAGTGIGEDGYAYGGGGGGTPSPTQGPSPTTPPFSPTPFVPPTSAPDAECDYGECCLYKWCGAGTSGEGGVFCGSRERCMYDPYFGWSCWSAGECP